jgi:hypothetical protein
MLKTRVAIFAQQQRSQPLIASDTRSMPRMYSVAAPGAMCDSSSAVKMRLKMLQEPEFNSSVKYKYSSVIRDAGHGSPAPLNAI